MKPALPALCTALLFGLGAAWYFGRDDRAPAAAGPSAASASENAPTPEQKLVSPHSEPALAAANERVVVAPGAETRAEPRQPVEPIGVELPPLDHQSKSVASGTPDTRADQYFEAKYAGFTRADYQAAHLALEQVAEKQAAVDVPGKGVSNATSDALATLQRELAWLKERAYP